MDNLFITIVQGCHNPTKLQTPCTECYNLTICSYAHRNFSYTWLHIYVCVCVYNYIYVYVYVLVLFTDSCTYMCVYYILCEQSLIQLNDSLGCCFTELLNLEYVHVVMYTV